MKRTKKLQNFIAVIYRLHGHLPAATATFCRQKWSKNTAALTSIFPVLPPGKPYIEFKIIFSLEKAWR